MADVFDTQLAHLIQMAGNQGTKEYAWNRSLELERCETGMWKGIAQELKQHMLARSSVARPKVGG